MKHWLISCQVFIHLYLYALNIIKVLKSFFFRAPVIATWFYFMHFISSKQKIVFKITLQQQSLKVFFKIGFDKNKIPNTDMVVIIIQHLFIQIY